MNAADIAQIAAGIFGVTGFGAGLAAYFKGRAQTREVEIGGVNALRSDDRKRINELEQRFDAERKHCDERLEMLNVRIIVVAQSTMELSSVVERHDPNSPALERAKLALQHAFPLNFATDAELQRLAREIARKAREDRGE